MMLDDLAAIPVSPADCHELLFGDIGSVVHEVGHVAGAALNGGAPTDYVLFDWSATALRHATYIDARYRMRFARDMPLQIRTLAAGIAAERLIFGEKCLPRATDDFMAIATLLGEAFDPDDMEPLVEKVLRDFDPIIAPDAVGILRTLYRRTVKKIRSRRYRMGSIDMIPFHALGCPAKLGLGERLRAIARTARGQERDAVINSFLVVDLRSGL